MGKADVTTHGAAQYHLPKIFFFHLMNSALRELFPLIITTQALPYQMMFVNQGNTEANQAVQLKHFTDSIQ